VVDGLLVRGAAAGAVEASVLDHSFVRGVAWTAAAKWIGQGLSWGSWLIVARLLSPEDYGLVGMAGIYLGLITFLSEFGLGTAVITFREMSVEQVSQLNGLALILGLGSLLTSCAVSIPLGHFFRAPQLPLVIVMMSATFVISSFKTVPLALLQRDLRFKALGLIDAGQAFVVAVCMVGFALAGFRYWTLVFGGVLGAALSTGAILTLHHAPFAWPRMRSLKPVMGLSSHVIVGHLSWYVYSNADFLVAGRVLGKAALGLYNFGWTLASMPVDRVTALVGQLTPAFFSAVQADFPALRRYLLRITEGIALIAFPVSLGIVLVAKDFVLVVLGAKWEGAIVPLRLLAAYAGFRSITPLLPQVLVSIRDSRFCMLHGISCAIVMPASFYFSGIRWGTVGLAMVWILVYPLTTLALFWRVFRKIHLSPRAYFGALWPAVSATALMGAVVLTVGLIKGPGWTGGWRLVTQIGAGVMTYLLVCLLLHRQRVRAFYAVVMAARRPAEAGAS
jgi:O-antigen/teichoic acid export membrane protein